MAIRLADTARPNNYVDAEHLGTFPVAYADDVWFEDGTRLSEKTFDNGGIQVEELPLASVDELGKVYQYIGESGTYTHGCFYECIEFIVLGESTYEWKRLNVIKNPVVSAEQPFSVKDYEDETVIVYSGEDLYDFKQGHHYIVKNNIGMDLYLITVTPKEGEEPIVAFVKNNPAQIGEHFYDVSGFCIGIIADITDVSISYYLFSSQTVKTYDNPRFSDMTGHFSATNYFDIGGGSSYQFSEDFVNEDNNVSLVPEQRIFTGTQAEWDALTLPEKKTYGQVNITDDDSTANYDVYSTEETKTNKVWIDGKPIYRKVFYINNPVINWTKVSLNLNDIDWIVTREYTAKRTNNAVITEYYNHDSDNYEVHLLTENGTVFYYCQCSTALSVMSITIEYTKTTD